MIELLKNPLHPGRGNQVIQGRSQIQLSRVHFDPFIKSLVVWYFYCCFDWLCC
jgi:hypothetical protein